MVHLVAIPSDKKKDEAKPAVVDTLMGKLNLADTGVVDTFTSSVYGSRYATQDLPRTEMPEREMPKEVAYRMIKDDLSLDGNPMLK